MHVCSSHQLLYFHFIRFSYVATASNLCIRLIFQQIPILKLVPKTNKIMITGGYNDGILDSNFNDLDSTEMLDIEDGSISMASPMNSKRYGHGMGVVTINGKDRLAVFGGHDGRTRLDSVELYNTQTEKWEMIDYKLSEAKSYFSFLTVKLEDILSQL